MFTRTRANGDPNETEISQMTAWGSDKSGNKIFSYSSTDSIEGYLTRKMGAAPIIEATWILVQSAATYFAG